MGISDRRQREVEERRKNILAAAKKVFREQGFQTASMPQIAVGAEIAIGTLYHYFPGKYALYGDLLVEGYDLLIPCLGAAARGGGDLPCVGGRLIDAFFDFSRKYPDYFHILFVTLRREKSGWEAFPEEQIRRLEAKERACKDIVAGVLERLPGSTPESRMRTVEAVWSMLAGVVFYFRDRDSFDAVSAEAKQLILTAVFGHNN